jgi:uncharacterized membrane protein YdjX (TVP38/TMEM64 family)
VFYLTATAQYKDHWFGYLLYYLWFLSHNLHYHLIFLLAPLFYFLIVSIFFSSSNLSLIFFMICTLSFMVWTMAFILFLIFFTSSPISWIVLIISSRKPDVRAFALPWYYGTSVGPEITVSSRKRIERYLDWYI